MLIREAYIIDADSFRRSGRYTFNDLLHLSIGRVKIAYVIPKDALRGGYLGPIISPCIEVKLLLNLSGNKIDQCKPRRKRE
jgi:hypothetical protein